MWKLLWIIYDNTVFGLLYTHLFWFAVWTSFLPLNICAVSHSHAIFASHLLPQSSALLTALVSNNTHNALPHCPRQWAEPAELWRPHVCVRVRACMYVCVCQKKWENAPLSCASILLLSRVVQLHTLSLSHTLRHAHTDSHTYTQGPTCSTCRQPCMKHSLH